MDNELSMQEPAADWQLRRSPDLALFGVRPFRSIVLVWRQSWPVQELSAVLLGQLQSPSIWAVLLVLPGWLAAAAAAGRALFGLYRDVVEYRQHRRQALASGGRARSASAPPPPPSLP